MGWTAIRKEYSLSFRLSNRVVILNFILWDANERDSNYLIVVYLHFQIFSIIVVLKSVKRANDYFPLKCTITNRYHKYFNIFMLWSTRDGIKNKPFLKVFKWARKYIYIFYSIQSHAQLSNAAVYLC